MARAARVQLGCDILVPRRGVRLPALLRSTPRLPVCHDTVPTHPHVHTPTLLDADVRTNGDLEMGIHSGTLHFFLVFPLPLPWS